MKLSYSIVLVLLLFVCASVAIRKSLPTQLMERIRNNRQATLDISGNSGCGNTTCSSDGTCPEFAFLNWQCTEDSICNYTAINDENVCTSVSKCGGAQTCNCPTSLRSAGCKCANDDECDSFGCIQGICVNYGYIGEYCDNTQYQCMFGVCGKDNTCQLSMEGGNCTSDMDCDLMYYCNSTTTTCAMRIPCNQTDDNTASTGYCPDFGTCYKGKCYPMYFLTEGESCIDQDDTYASHVKSVGDLERYYCQPGLACLYNEDSGFTCQHVPFGTPCNDTYDCEFMTQDCMCVDPDDSVPMQCLDYGANKCVNQLTAAFQCFVTENCIQYDFEDNTTACSQNCLPIMNEVNCCLICAYPEIANNAYGNIMGSCADNTMTMADCCSDNAPCTIIETEKLCAGYIS